MRRAIILTAIIPALAVAAVRLQSRPLFAGEAAYQVIRSTLEHAHYHLLLQLLLLALFLLSAAILYRERQLPSEGLAVLGLTPIVITALVTPSANALAIGALIAIAAINWERRHVLAPIAVAGTLIPGGWSLGLALAASGLAKRARIIVAAGLVLAAVNLFGYPPLLDMPGLAELGAISGVGAAIVFLAGTGVVVGWRRSSYRRLLLALAVVVAALFLPRQAYAGALAASVLAGLALHSLRSRSWRLEAIKQATLYLVVLAVLFAAVSAGGAAVRAEPGDGLFIVAQFLRGEPDSSVLVLPAHLASARWAGIPATSAHIDSLRESYRIADARLLLPKYVLLHEEDIFPGLEFLIENTDDFETLYKGEYSLYEVKNAE